MHTETDEYWMNEALREAGLALEHEDVPIACIVTTAEGEELARAHNRREIDGDPTAHAEVLAVQGAARKLGHWRLDSATVYATLEPCAMCAGALVNARVSRLVYAAHDPKAGAVCSLYSIGTDQRLNHRFQVTSGVCAEASIALLRCFFAKLRAEGQR